MTSRQTIEVVEYDAEWTVRFEGGEARILGLIGEFVVAVEHIGSTSVSGLAAKPIVDVLVGLRSLGNTHEIVARMTGTGYRYVPEFEADLPERRYFSRDEHRDPFPSLAYGRNDFRLLDAASRVSRLRERTRRQPASMGP